VIVNDGFVIANDGRLVMLDVKERVMKREGSEKT
jgi:hypothetical protein